jgi:hypothetical protein
MKSEMSISTPTPSPFLLITDRLAAIGVPYLITGSVAAMLYGRVRLTLDIDIILSLDIATARRFPDTFPANDFYCPPPEVILLENSREMRGHFNILHLESGFKADLYIAGRDPFHRWAFEHAKRRAVEGRTVTVAPIEYVIIRKLEFFREGGSEKHLQDIRTMLEISSSQIDWNKLDELVAERRLNDEWQRAGNVAM